MALFLRRTKWTAALSFSSFSSVAALLPPTILAGARGLRSDAALEAISKAREEKVTNLVLYNYPSFSGAFSALFAHLFHLRLHLPCLILPFSSIIHFRVRDLWIEGLERCYFLDFLAPRGFADVLSRQVECEIIGFDHRKSVLSRVQEECTEKVKFYVDVEKSSSKAVYEYFSTKLGDMESSDGETATLLNPEEQDRVETVLKYIEDSDLQRWSLPERKAFSIGIGEWRSRINCVTNPYMFEELLDMSATDLIAKGDSYISTRQNAASKLLYRVFKVRLGRGLYGECLGVRADENANLTDEIGKQLSIRSAAAGLSHLGVCANKFRPIGAVVYMQRKNLKMCLRSTDSTTDTSEVAKAYGGGGSLSSSSFIIRMDEYNEWLSGGVSR